MADNVNPASPNPQVYAIALVEALENVILPIVKFHIPGLALNIGTVNSDEFREGDSSRLMPEAQQLVSALENFITTLLRPQIVQQGTIKSEKVTHLAVETPEDVPDAVTAPALDANLSIIRISENRITTPQSPFLKEALKQAHHCVFNKMPIRLLAFKSDGSGIELVERSTVFGRIAVALESELNEEDADSIEEVISRHTKYAILSHTWLRNEPGEVTYSAWRAREFDHGSAGYQKVANFCRTAATDHGITFGWMDTVCINKDSSAELDESIRSMYAWYANASVCITYLAETTTLQHMHKDSWFTRGWTLQELLSPQSIEFYGDNWQRLPTFYDSGWERTSIEYEILAATGISQKDRDLFRKSRYNIPISERMKWAADRQVTRQEDVAYSLMGIFDVSLSIAYGEGSERAFVRLLKEVMNLAGESTLDILNCGGGSSVVHDASNNLPSIIPSSPKQYLERSDLDIHWPAPRIPVTLTHLGLHVSVLLMPAISVDPRPRHALQWVPIGQFFANVDVELQGQRQYFNEPLITPTRYNVLDKANISCALSNGWNFSDARFYVIFGLLNFVDNGDSICLPSFYDYSFPNVTPDIRHSYGFALCFTMASGRLQRIPSSRPVTLDMKTHKPNAFRGNIYEIPKSELGEHGMELRTVYL